MAKFKKGDVVTIVDNGIYFSNFIGNIGKITEVYAEDSDIFDFGYGVIMLTGTKWQKNPTAWYFERHCIIHASKLMRLIF